MKTNIQVKFDDESIRLFQKEKEVWTLRWEEIERIGYSTNKNLSDDYSLVFKKKCQPPLYYHISMYWDGTLELSKYIDCLPDTKLPPEGKLANCTENKSVTVWPMSKSGEPL